MTHQPTAPTIDLSFCTISSKPAEALYAQIMAAYSAQTPSTVADEIRTLTRVIDLLSSTSMADLNDMFRERIAEIKPDAPSFDKSEGEALARAIDNVLGSGFELPDAEVATLVKILDAWKNAPKGRATRSSGGGASNHTPASSLGFTVFAYHTSTGDRVLTRTGKADLNSLRHYALKAAEEAGVTRPTRGTDTFRAITEAARKVMDGEASQAEADGFIFTRSA